MDEIDLKEYLPICYSDITEPAIEQDALSIEINKYNDTIEQALNDQFIQTCSLKAIGYYEETFHIVANPAIETLQFRRDRVLNRMKSLRPPYTYWYLRQMLDKFFGVGRYKLEIDNDNYVIILESSAEDSQWYHEIQVSLTLIKPCNMTFINKPQTIYQLLTNETVKSQQTSRNYKLNNTWLLGLKPFVSREDEEIRKMASVESIRQHFIDINLENWVDLFKKVIINNSISITDFDISIQTEGVLIEYLITYQMTNTITNIKLLDAEDIPLINSNVFIPIDDSVTVKHIIKLEEGVNG